MGKKNRVIAVLILGRKKWNPENSAELFCERNRDKVTTNQLKEKVEDTENRPNGGDLAH